MIDNHKDKPLAPQGPIPPVASKTAVAPAFTTSLPPEDYMREQEQDAVSGGNGVGPVEPPVDPPPAETMDDLGIGPLDPYPVDGELPETTTPVLTALSPTDCTIGDPDFTIHLTGTGFAASSVIVFAGNDEPTTLETDGTLSTGVNMTLWVGPDTVPVAVRNGATLSNELPFTFIAMTRKERR